MLSYILSKPTLKSEALGTVAFKQSRPGINIDDAQMPPMMVMVMRADRRRLLQRHSVARTEPARRGADDDGG